MLGEAVRDVAGVAKAVTGVFLSGFGMTAGVIGMGHTGVRSLVEAAGGAAAAVAGWLLVPAETTQGRRVKALTVGVASTAALAAARAR